MNPSVKNWLFACGIVSIGLVYLPGLSAGFILDDFATLPFLGQWGGVDSFSGFIEYIESGFTGPTGRPVALLSFLFNSREWPAETFPFLSFNLAIHIANTCLAFFLARHFLLLLGTPSANWVAVTSSLIWAAHPYLVSTVLYIVQRMLLLAVFFNLLALIAYLNSRAWIVKGRFLPSLPGLALALLMVILAVFSKEMAILIPLQVAIVEVTIIAAGGLPLWKLAVGDKFIERHYGMGLAFTGMLVPLLCIFGYLFLPLYYEMGHYLSSGVAGPSVREFSLVERLLTQQRVIGEYFTNFFIPPVQTAGVFWDGYSVSKSIFSPISTLFWMLIHGTVITVSWYCRRKIPLVFFGVFWFYGGLLLESTTVMLELKFEHRAYWPYWGLAIAAMSCLYQAKIQIAKRNTIVASIFGILLILLFARASLWGKPEQAYPVWMAENPNSNRAIESAIVSFSAIPELQSTIPILLSKGVQHPNSKAGIYLQAFTYFCVNQPDRKLDIEEMQSRLANGERDWRVTALLSDLFNQMRMSQCTLDLDTYKDLVGAVLNNPSYYGTGVPVSLNSTLASAEYVFGDKDKAAEYFLLQDHSKTPFGLIMNQSLLLASYGGLGVAAKNLELGLKSPFGASEFLQLQGADMLAKIEKELKSGAIDD